MTKTKRERVREIEYYMIVLKIYMNITKIKNRKCYISYKHIPVPSIIFYVHTQQKTISELKLFTQKDISITLLKECYS